MKHVQWARNAGPSIACGLIPIVLNKWVLGAACAVGMYLFAALVDMAIGRLLRKNRAKNA